MLDKITSFIDSLLIHAILIAILLFSMPGTIIIQPSSEAEEEELIEAVAMDEEQLREVFDEIEKPEERPPTKVAITPPLPQPRPVAPPPPPVVKEETVAEVGDKPCEQLERNNSQPFLNANEKWRLKKLCKQQQKEERQQLAEAQRQEVQKENERQERLRRQQEELERKKNVDIQRQQAEREKQRLEELKKANKANLEKERRPAKEIENKRKAKEELKKKRQQEQQLAREKAKEKEKPRVTEQQQAEAEEAKRLRAAEKARQQADAEAKRRAAQEKARQQAEAKRRTDEQAAATAQKAEEARRAQQAAQAASQARVGQVIAQIRQRVKSRWRQPPGSNLRCVVSIRILPGGGIVAGVGASSGNVAFDQSAVSAAYSAAPFPIPKELFEYVRKQGISVTFSSR